MNAYSYDSVTGEYLGAVTCQESPLEKDVYLVPAHATMLPPPGSLADNTACVWDGSSWEEVTDNRGKKAYLMADSRITFIVKTLGDSLIEGYTLTPPPDPSKQYIMTDGVWAEKQKTPEEMTAEYERAVDSHIDSVAKDNDFDSILTCTKYAGFDNAFRTHAEALLAWNASCWVACHTVLDAVIDGQRDAPTVEQLISELPAFVWPVDNS